MSADLENGKDDKENVYQLTWRMERMIKRIYIS